MQSKITALKVSMHV